MSDSGNIIKDNSDSPSSPEPVRQGGNLQEVVEVARQAILGAESFGDEPIKHFEIPFASFRDCLFWGMGEWVHTKGGGKERASILALNALEEELNIKIRTLSGGGRPDEAK